jgi:hypothetical protein
MKQKSRLLSIGLSKIEHHPGPRQLLGIPPIEFLKQGMIKRGSVSPLSVFVIARGFDFFAPELKRTAARKMLFYHHGSRRRKLCVTIH